MRRTELRLSAAERRAVEAVRGSGMHLSREVSRAHILAALDRGIPDAQICAVLGVERTAVWRTRSAYMEQGVEFALRDAPRPGKPRKYASEQEAEITALACSAPPAGARRWTVRRLTEEVNRRPGLERVSRETVRRVLKKTFSNRGAT